MTFLIGIYDLIDDDNTRLANSWVKGQVMHICGTKLTLTDDRLYYCGLCEKQGWLLEDERFPECEWVLGNSWAYLREQERLAKEREQNIGT